MPLDFVRRHADRVVPSADGEVGIEDADGNLALRATRRGAVGPLVDTGAAVVHISDPELWDLGTAQDRRPAVQGAISRLLARGRRGTIRFVDDLIPTKRPIWVPTGTGLSGGAGFNVPALSCAIELSPDYPPDPGTLTGVGDTTLTDTSKAWAVNQWVDYAVFITSGNRRRAMRRILSNTANTLTLSGAYWPWPTVDGGDPLTYPNGRPSVGDTYEIRCPAIALEDDARGCRLGGFTVVNGNANVGDGIAFGYTTSQPLLDWLFIQGMLYGVNLGQYNWNVRIGQLWAQECLRHGIIAPCSAAPVNGLAIGEVFVESCGAGGILLDGVNALRLSGHADKNVGGPAIQLISCRGRLDCVTMESNQNHGLDIFDCSLIADSVTVDTIAAAYYPVRIRGNPGSTKQFVRLSNLYTTGTEGPTSLELNSTWGGRVALEMPELDKAINDPTGRITHQVTAEGFVPGTGSSINRVVKARMQIDFDPIPAYSKGYKDVAILGSEAGAWYGSPELDLGDGLAAGDVIFQGAGLVRVYVVNYTSTARTPQLRWWNLGMLK